MLFLKSLWVSYLLGMIVLLCMAGMCEGRPTRLDSSLAVGPDVPQAHEYPIAPMPPSSALASSPPSPPTLSRRGFVITNVTGTRQVINPDTRQLIPQTPASDAGGSGFDVTAVLWIVFGLLTGLPMALAGMRGWKLTMGIVLGLSSALIAWASFINSMTTASIPDLVLTIIVLVFFLAGLIMGLFQFVKNIALALMGITGGLAIGIRVMILRKNLLISNGRDVINDDYYVVTWIVIAVFGVLGGMGMLFKRRAGIVTGCASLGTFMTFLSIDLIVNQQSGMGRGLIFLFDRNVYHIADIIWNGYEPPLSTQILVGVSLGLIPILAFTQHKLFPRTFCPKDQFDEDAEAALNSPIKGMPSKLEKGFKNGEPSLLQSEDGRRQSAWDGAVQRFRSRFSWN